MKKYIIILTLFSISLCSFSQDVIIRTNGHKIDCKITKTDSLTVFFDFTKNGNKLSTSLPKNKITEIIYEVKKENSLSDSITIKEVFGGFQIFYKGKRLNMNQLVKTLEPNEHAFKEIKQAKSAYSFSLALGFAGGFLIGYPVGMSFAGDEPNWTMAAVGAGLIGVSIPISVKVNKKIKSAVDIYNNELKTSSFWHKNELNFTLSENGIGLTLKF